MKSHGLRGVWEGLIPWIGGISWIGCDRSESWEWDPMDWGGVEFSQNSRFFDSKADFLAPASPRIPGFLFPGARDFWDQLLFPSIHGNSL